MKTRKRSTTAFSLVELSIALGVITFCLLTIIGLLAIGVNSTHSSTTQTGATNILTAVTSDLQAVPNVTPASGSAKGTVANPAGTSRNAINTSPLYNLTVPVAGSSTTGTYTLYMGENGLTNASPTGSVYQVNIWIYPANSSSYPTHQETFARVLITWPVLGARYTNAQGFVENIVAINRT
ncbi:MAG TPA: hypothetical protein VIM71_12990 [Lacunisphaera sp.]